MNLHKHISSLRPVLKVLLVALGFFFVYFIFCLPSTLFEQSYSKVLLDRNGQLLEARIASDEQWRFPIVDSIPPKFEQCILTFEDKNFRKHPGVNPIAIARAIYLNLKYKKVVSGGSTITMQTVRLARKNRNRSVYEKLIEMIWALRLELRHSKNHILNLYVSHAPFGGNVVGLETASWRYFNRSPFELSWAESAMLAVLPNAPGLIHINKNRDALKNKRNKLLASLLEEEKISNEVYNMAVNEPLPKPLNTLPHHAYHLVDRLASDQGRIHSTIDYRKQKQFNNICLNYSDQMKIQNIHNLSAILINVKTGEVEAYVGNIHQSNDDHAGMVDMLQSVRSSGSILKPILYTAAVDEGLITPRQLVPDYPMNFYGYRPANYNPNFDGLVPADEALYRSLNIPSAWLLSKYGISKMKHSFGRLGLSSINRPASNYGLSMILGGAEVNLLELTTSYASLGNQLIEHEGDEFQSYLTLDSVSVCLAKQIFDDGSVYSILTALTNTYRPETEAHWKSFSSGNKIAWKTGTSFGNRDAWAVGVTTEYAVGVWIGNSDGQGISGMTGLNHAAPLLFELYGTLPSSSWFYEPYNMSSQMICTSSGMKAQPTCPNSKEEVLPSSSDRTKRCSYHKSILVDNHGQRVYKECSTGPTYFDTAFVLPPIISYYYQKKHPDHKNLPAWKPDCASSNSTINLLYPINKGIISLPRGEQGEITGKAFVENKKTELFWDLNGEYIGSTVGLHELLLKPTSGENTLHLTDETGHTIKTSFTVK